MSGFIRGIEKTAKKRKSASKSGFMKFISGAKEFGTGVKKKDGFVQGIVQAGNTPLKKHLNPMHGINGIVNVSGKHGGLLQALKKPKSRAALGAAFGRAVPSLVAGKVLYDLAKSVYNAASAYSSPRSSTGWNEYTGY